MIDRRSILEDKAKVQIIRWAIQNPHWTPESLMKMCKFFILHYGLKNRYAVPGEKEEVKDDSAKVEANPSGSPESGRDSGTT